MTKNFDRVYKLLLKEGGVYGSVGGTASGPNKSESNPNAPQQTVSNTQVRAPNQKGVTNTPSAPYKRITNKRINPSTQLSLSKVDYSKDNTKNQLDSSKINSYDYVDSLSQRILTGQALHPVHLNNLAGILEVNPDLAREMKTKGITSDAIGKNYLKQGIMGSNVQIDKNLETRFRNIFK